MCTVSWLPGPDGYSLWFNRDERFSRAPALPPAVREAGGVRFLAPLDGDFGGTWLLANEHGLTLGLLNRYALEARRPAGGPPGRSRGLLVLDLAAAHSQEDALDRLGPAALAPVQPFTLVLAEPRRPVLLAAWDGRALALSRRPAPGFVLTSSSVTEPEVARNREALFAALERPDGPALAALHRSHLPARGRLSVCMHRDDAETQSFSEIEVTPTGVRFSHVPDAPCRGTALPPLLLARRTTPCPA